MFVWQNSEDNIVSFFIGGDYDTHIIINYMPITIFTKM